MILTKVGVLNQYTTDLVPTYMHAEYTCVFIQKHKGKLHMNHLMKAEDFREHAKRRFVLSKNKVFFKLSFFLHAWFIVMAIARYLVMRWYTWKKCILPILLFFRHRALLLKFQT